MLRLSKMTDYAIVLLTYIVSSDRLGPVTARLLSEESRLPLPTVSKVLKTLSRAGILVSTRGKNGGYRLARPPEYVSVAGIIAAIDGPLSMTECSAAAPLLCDLEACCPVRKNWQTINGAVVQALEGLTLEAMAYPLKVQPTPGGRELAAGAGGTLLTFVKR